jgi:hypothetical protein
MDTWYWTLPILVLFLFGPDVSINQDCVNKYDFNHDSHVDILDFSVMQNNWNCIFDIGCGLFSNKENF